MKWTNKPPVKEGFYFVCYDCNNICIDNVKVTRFHRDKDGKIFGKHGYVTSDSYKFMLFSDCEIFLPEV